MVTKSAFSVVGLAHKMCLAAERQGYTPDLLNTLAEHPTLLGDMLKVQLGCASIVVIKRLRHVGTISLPAFRKNHDSREFFRNRDGLYVWESFRTCILPVVSPLKKRAPKAELSVFDLTKVMTNEEIRTELGDGYIFEDAGIPIAPEAREASKTATPILRPR